MFSEKTWSLVVSIIIVITLIFNAIRKNLVEQLTGAFRWTQTIQNMIADGTTHFTEIGPGKFLQGLINKVDKTVMVESKSAY